MLQKNQKKFQKKVIALINAIKKCDDNDLNLFIALCFIKFTNMNSIDSYLECITDFQNELSKDENIVALLK